MKDLETLRVSYGLGQFGPTAPLENAKRLCLGVKREPPLPGPRKGRWVGNSLLATHLSTHEYE